MRLFSHILATVALLFCTAASAGYAFAASDVMAPSATLQEQLDTAKKLQDEVVKYVKCYEDYRSGLNVSEVNECDVHRDSINALLNTSDGNNGRLFNFDLNLDALSTKDDVLAQKEMQKVNQVVRELATSIEKTRRVHGDILSISGQSHFPTAKVLLDSVIDLLIKLIGLAALILLVFGGFRLIIAAGNDTEIQRAKDMIQYAVIGLVVALLSFIIVAVVQALLFR